MSKLDRFGDKRRPPPTLTTNASVLCAKIALPNLFKVYKRNSGDNGTLRGVQAMRRYVKRLAEIERQLTEWEAANPEKHRETPWYEAREEYKRLKAEGRPPTTEWWMIEGKIRKLAGAGTVAKGYFSRKVEGSR